MNEPSSALYDYWQSLILEEQRNAERNRRLLTKLNEIEQRTSMLNKRTERLSELRRRFASMIKDQYLDPTDVVAEVFDANMSRGCIRRDGCGSGSVYHPPDYIPDPLMFGVTTPPWVPRDNRKRTEEEETAPKCLTTAKNNQRRDSRDVMNYDKGASVDEESDDVPRRQETVKTDQSNQDRIYQNETINENLKFQRRRSSSFGVGDVNANVSDISTTQNESYLNEQQSQQQPSTSRNIFQNNMLGQQTPTVVRKPSIRPNGASLERNVSIHSSTSSSPTKPKSPQKANGSPTQKNVSPPRPSFVHRDVESGKKQPMHNIIQPGPSILKTTDKQSMNQSETRRTSFRRRSSSATAAPGSSSSSPLAQNQAPEVQQETKTQQEKQAERQSDAELKAKEDQETQQRQNVNRRQSTVESDQNEKNSSDNATKPSETPSTSVPKTGSWTVNRSAIEAKPPGNEDNSNIYPANKNEIENDNQVKRSSSLSRQRRLERRRSQAGEFDSSGNPSFNSAVKQNENKTEDSMTDEEIRKLRDDFERKERERMENLSSDSPKIDQFSQYLPANLQPGISLKSFQQDIHTPDLDGIYLNKTMSMLIAEELRRNSNARDVRTQEEMTQTSQLTSPVKEDYTSGNNPQRRTSLAGDDKPSSASLMDKRESEMDISQLTAGMAEYSPSEDPVPDLGASGNAKKIDKGYGKDSDLDEDTSSSKTKKKLRKKHDREQSKSRERNQSLRRKDELKDMSTASSSRSSTPSSAKNQNENKRNSNKNSDAADESIRQMLSDSFFDTHSKLAETSAYKSLLANEKNITAKKQPDNPVSSDTSEDVEQIYAVQQAFKSQTEKLESPQKSEDQTDLPSNTSTPPAYFVPARNVKELITTKVKHDVPAIISKKVMGLDLYRDVEPFKRDEDKKNDEDKEEDSFFD